MILFKQFLLIILVLSLCSVTILKAQQCKVTFLYDTSITEYKSVRIEVLQGTVFSSSVFKPNFYVLCNSKLTIHFTSQKIKIEGYKNLLITKDTTIRLRELVLPEVKVKSKKELVNQTLDGFEYYPYKDSLFKNQPVYYALQRIPFISIDEIQVKYKDNKKIFYKIDGKERKGISSWVDVLKSIPAKNIYRIELLTEVPTLYANQGYDAIMNIETMGANLHGKSYSVAATYDQRKNLTPTANYTQLYKNTDFTSSYSRGADRYTQQNRYEVRNALSGNTLIDRATRNTYNYSSTLFSADFGVRIDSVKNFYVGAKYFTDQNRFQFEPIALQNSYQPPLTLQSLNGRGELHTSFIKDKNKRTASWLASFLISERFQNNRTGFAHSNTYDSVLQSLKKIPVNIIAEYNYTNNQKQKIKFEYGIQASVTHVAQHYGLYSLNPANNKILNTIEYFDNILNATEITVRPYFNYRYNISTKKFVLFRLNPEYYLFKNQQSDFSFLLPNIAIRYKKLLTSKTAIAYSVNHYYAKPSANYLAAVSLPKTPFSSELGLTNLVPSRALEGSITMTKSGNFSTEQKLTVFINTRLLEQITVFDSAANKSIIVLNQSGAISRASYSIYAQKTIKKKLTIASNFSFSYDLVKNKAYHFQNSGFELYNFTDVSFTLPAKAGRLSFASRAKTADITSQGKAISFAEYNVSYVRLFFKRRVVFVAKASNFLAANRTLYRESIFDHEIQRISETRPYRNFSIRLAYHFSTIKSEIKATREKASKFNVQEE